MDIKEIAAEVRRQLKAEFPKCGWSVTIERYSMGQSLHVALTSAPESPFASLVDENGNIHKGDYAQMNQYQLRRNEPDQWDYVCNGARLTPEAWSMLKRADEIGNARNWDHSDLQTDYHNVNYYFHLDIGRWDKPFVVK